MTAAQWERLWTRYVDALQARDACTKRSTRKGASLRLAKAWRTIERSDERFADSLRSLLAERGETERT